jgi:hypothetical protein
MIKIKNDVPVIPENKENSLNLLFKTLIPKEIQAVLDKIINKELLLQKPICDEFLKQISSIQEELTFLCPNGKDEDILFDDKEIEKSLRENAAKEEVWLIHTAGFEEVAGINMIKVCFFNTFINEGKTLLANVYLLNNKIKHINFSNMD